MLVAYWVDCSVHYLVLQTVAMTAETKVTKKADLMVASSVHSGGDMWVAMKVAMMVETMDNDWVDWLVQQMVHEWVVMMADSMESMTVSSTVGH
jgi:ubiquinone biosynthesis protein UbiJ